MSLYSDYLKEIENRKNQGLSAKPIDDAFLLNEIIANIKDKENKHRTASVDFFIYNVLPGTTSAAAVKADFLKQIIIKKQNVEGKKIKCVDFKLVGDELEESESERVFGNEKNKLVINSRFKFLKIMKVKIVITIFIKDACRT